MSFKSKTVIGPRKKNPLPVGNKALSCGSVTPNNNKLLKLIASHKIVKEVAKGNIKAVREYINNEKSINKRFYYGTSTRQKSPRSRRPKLTLLEIAVKNNKKEIADLLRKHGSKTVEELKAEGK